MGFTLNQAEVVVTLTDMEQHSPSEQTIQNSNFHEKLHQPLVETNKLKACPRRWTDAEKLWHVPQLLRELHWISTAPQPLNSLHVLNYMALREQE